MSSSLPFINIVILSLNLLGGFVALSALLPLSKIAELTRNPLLKRAWHAMSLVMCACIGMLIASAKISSDIEIGSYDVVATGIHIFGPIFVFGVAKLSLLTARDLLKIDQLQVAAHTDPLTTALNRAGFFAAVEAEKAQIGIIMVDLDHFKRINDQLGHEAGDHVLRRFVEHAKSTLPSSSHFARFGGEEFVIALPTATLDATFGIAEGLRAALNAHQIDWPVAPIRITASFGVSLAPSGREIAVALARADKALYAAKHAGRNQVLTG